MWSMQELHRHGGLLLTDRLKLLQLCRRLRRQPRLRCGMAGGLVADQGGLVAHRWRLQKRLPYFRFLGFGLAAAGPFMARSCDEVAISFISGARPSRLACLPGHSLGYVAAKFRHTSWGVEEPGAVLGHGFQASVFGAVRATFQSQAFPPAAFISWPGLSWQLPAGGWRCQSLEPTRIQAAAH